MYRLLSCRALDARVPRTEYQSGAGVSRDSFLSFLHEMVYEKEKRKLKRVSYMRWFMRRKREKSKRPNLTYMCVCVDSFVSLDHRAKPSNLAQLRARSWYSSYPTLQNHLLRLHLESVSLLRPRKDRGANAEQDPQRNPSQLPLTIALDNRGIWLRSG